MILTVTPNPALDLTYRVPELIPGSSHRVTAPTVRAGGKGLNVARVAHSQGHDALALCTAGGQSGAQLLSELSASGVPFEAVAVGGETRRSTAIVTDTGSATVFNERGGTLSAGETSLLIDAVRRGAARARVVAISGSMPPGTGLLEQLIDAARGAEVHGGAAGKPTPALIVDTSGPAMLAAAAAGAQVLKPNHLELAEATGIGDPVMGAQQLIALGASLVVISLGEEGMIAVSAAGPLVTARLPRVLSGNPTGAGDAAVAAIAASLTELPLDAVIRDPSGLLQRAVAWSAAAVLMPTAGEISASHTALASEVVIELA